MKTKLLIILSFFALKFYSQTDSLIGFDRIHLNEHLSEFKDQKNKDAFVKLAERNFIREKYDLSPKTIFSSKTSTSTCTNLDFEDGNTNGWTLTGDFSLMSGSGIDPFGGFPVVCPGGNYSLRLQDNNVVSKTNFKSTASQTISISAANSTIKVNFAGALLNFPHSAAQAAVIKIEFFDQLNNIIPTQTTSVYYSNPPGALTPTTVTSFTSSTTGYNIGNQPYAVQYVPWQQLSFNLSSFIGQNVSIKLSANWCIYNYDWLYAYFDVCCSATCPDPFSVTGISSLSNTNSVEVYPSPFKNEITINGSASNSEFILMSADGKEVLRKKLNGKAGSIPVAELPSGIYFYTLSNENQLIKKGKLVKE